jgi:hypothetical protein
MKIKTNSFFLKIKNYFRFVNVKTDPRLVGNSKPPGAMRNTDQQSVSQSDHIYYTLFLGCILQKLCPL